MEFCPTCGNMLQYELPHMGRPSRFFCPTCPYVCHLENKVKIKRRQHLVKKEIEPVFNKEDMKMGGSETDGKLIFLFLKQHALLVAMGGLFSHRCRSGQLMSRLRHSISA
ncbi:DNA-directed RNA polymerase III subunit RPC10 isoform X2 [Gossypium raimondii]|uniref:DNA-directed RNA polymerase III subunit RPC10 isoform X2 n=1 Tax=Gossypium raimondii TaxID=29730 RepID=UPI00227A412E|nr:DNA-directed RNA polymerase III subunit RPC10 isoform X2 [Gossypium raimondii]